MRWLVEPALVFAIASGATVETTIRCVRKAGDLPQSCVSRSDAIEGAALLQSKAMGPKLVTGMLVALGVGQCKPACDEANIRGCGWQDCARLAPKLVRLGFHDCLKYADGTGGCDGCLHWDGVEGRYRNTAGSWSIDAGDHLSHNNGLRVAVELMEELYTNPIFPAHSPPLTSSLRSTGKSRADLWAFASIVAVEYTIGVNNGVCSDPDYEHGRGWGLDTNGANVRHCNHMRGSAQCHVNLTRPIAFQSGRRDCASGYRAAKEESQPNAEGNGQLTLDYFRRDFNFTSREAVAIMGAHTLGRLHNKNSLFKYVWVHAGGMQFNNQYYRNIAGKRDFRFVVTQSECKQVGDAWGQGPPVRWVTHVRKDKVTGGPVHWIQEKLTCPAACASSPQSDACCTDSVPAGALCRPDAGRANGSDAASADDDINGGCERYRFISGLDEMALSAEMGLYYDFQLDANSTPAGCPGLHDFDYDHWKTEHRGHTWSNRNGVRAEPGCPKNMRANPPESTPVYQIVEEYADSQAAWIRDFVPAYEKMLANGYAATDLAAGPDRWTRVACSDRLFFVCWRTDGLSARFYIASDHDQRVLQHDQHGVVQLKTRSPGVDEHQLWQWTAAGDVLINVRTGWPLVIHGNGQWEWRSQSSWYTPPAGHRVLARPASSGPECIDTGWGRHDIASVGWWKCWGGPIQHFGLDYV
eukprot:CAMPEP_0171189598 /NCGR_PEP_ID=MMETSP0790-20130122/18428_1 /TAXON_ID=2925 /ORGANISM="Alexandrium catenella, Strain OF101" /LENGTH=694 /DNA_ID=CAMNT_0011654713 /DNA_START=38 /DNA_END=2123 /DNA_ORIENTATION=+